MEIARALQGEVRARVEPVEADTPQSVAELGLAFSRVSRAVRQTLALEARLEDDRLARERAAEDRQWTSEAVERAARARARLMWRPYLDDEAWDDDDLEDLSDGPDDDRGEGFVADRPAADVVAGVCGDLGIEPDLSFWTDEDGAGVPVARGDGGAAPPAAIEEHREAATALPPHPDGTHKQPP